MGVIAVETRTIERIVPADPANASSMEQKIMEAGQVSHIFSHLSTQANAIVFSQFCRFGTQILLSRLLKLFSISIEKVYHSLSLPIGEDSLEDNKICLMKFSRGKHFLRFRVFLKLTFFSIPQRISHCRWSFSLQISCLRLYCP